MDMSGDEKYVHRKKCGSELCLHCLQCFRTVAVSNDEGVLVELENLHECSGSEIRMDARMENPLRRGGQFAL